MVGGGQGAFIGGVHRMAARLDDRYELVCGAFSSTPEKSKASGRDLLVPDDRVYGSFQEMYRAEARLPADRRMDAVAIVTPNHVHFPAAMGALQAGFHVICDKPMTLTVAQAKTLEQTVRKTGLLFCLTHNYTGNAMVKEARHLVASGQLGKVRRVVVQYPQGWLATRIEAAGQKQASWRTDPKRSGAGGCLGDIGSHCENLAEYITGDRIAAVCAELTTFVKGRQLDDDVNVLLRFAKGARGVLWSSQIAVGEENGLAIRVYGEKGGLQWRQEEPNSLVVRWLDKPMEIRRTGVGNSPAAAAVTRIPAGHPEGYLEAFANLYRSFADALTQRLAGKRVNERDFDYPTVEDGRHGMEFIAAVVASARSKAKWVKV
jgi:predicted dehydrogenase